MNSTTPLDQQWVPERWSHSALDQLGSCGEMYRLKRVQLAPEIPSVARVGGSAFHVVTADYDLGKLTEEDALGVWPAVLEDATQEDEEKYDCSREFFTTAGRKTKLQPDGESLKVWRDKLGPEMLELYFKRDRPGTFARDLPADKDGNTTGVEYGLEIDLDGVTWVQYVDRLYWDVDGNLVIEDIKTWQAERTTAQLRRYAVALREVGLPAWKATYYNSRTGNLSGPWHINHGREYLALEVARANQIVAQGLFLPVVGEHCRRCDVRSSCNWKNH